MTEEPNQAPVHDAYIPEYWLLLESIYLITGKEVISNNQIVAVNEPTIIKVVLPASFHNRFGPTGDVQIVGYATVGFNFYVRSSLLGNRNMIQFTARLPQGVTDFNQKAVVTVLSAETLGVLRPSLAECFTSKDPNPKIRILEKEHPVSYAEYQDFDLLIKNMSVIAHKLGMARWLYEPI